MVHLFKSAPARNRNSTVLTLQAKLIVGISNEAPEPIKTRTPLREVWYGYASDAAAAANTRKQATAVQYIIAVPSLSLWQDSMAS